MNAFEHAKDGSTSFYFGVPLALRSHTLCTADVHPALAKWSDCGLSQPPSQYTSSVINTSGKNVRTGADEWRTVLQPTARFWTAVWLLYRQESHVETNLSPDPPALLGWEFEVVENFPGFALFFIVVLSGAVSTGCAMLHQLLREKQCCLMCPNTRAAVCLETGWETLLVNMIQEYWIAERYSSLNTVLLVILW